MIINDKRALAYIQHVTNIRPIDGADNIEQCNVLGWNLICKERNLNSFVQKVLRSRR